MRAVTERDNVSSGCNDSLIDYPRNRQYRCKRRGKETQRTSLSVCSPSRSALIRVRVSVRDAAIFPVGEGAMGSSIFG